MNRNLLSVVPCALGLAIAAGCVRSEYSSTPNANPASSNHAANDGHDHDHDRSRHAEEGHAHGAGPHGGTVVDWGRGKYHLEFTVDHSKQQAVVYVMGSDEKTPVAIVPPDGKILLTISSPSFQLELIADPQEGESGGAASRFVGVHEKLGDVQKLAGTISGQVDGVPYAGDFQETAHAEAAQKE